MVTEEAQIYTIEGVAASVLILVTAYVVLSGTYIFTAGDVHIYDMQLEQLGTDVLQRMDIPNMDDTMELSPLERNLIDFDQTAPEFNDRRIAFIESFQDIADDNRLKLKTTIYYYKKDSNEIVPVPFYSSSEYTGKENYVTLKRWIHLQQRPSFISEADWADRADSTDRSHTVLLEVVLWRD